MINNCNKIPDVHSEFICKDRYSVEVIDDLNKFKNIKEQWNSLAFQHSKKYLFLSHDWYELWLHYFLKDSDLCIITVSRDDKLVAIAPFIRKHVSIKRVPVILLQTIGNAYSPLSSLIIDVDENEATIGHILFNALADEGPDWDIVQIGPLYDGKIYEQTKKLFVSSRYEWVEKVVDTNWRLTCDGLNYDDYLKKLKKSVRQEIKRRNKKIESLGNVEISIAKGTEAYKIIDDYFHVYSNSWKKEEKLGPGFHKDLAKIAADENNLLIAIMYLDKKPIAAQYRLLCGKKCYFIKTAYDENYHEYSVGILLLNHVLKHLMNNENVKIIDFGPGNEGYKANWAGNKFNYNNIYLFNDSIKGKFIHLAYTKIDPIARMFKFNKCIQCL